MQNFLLIGSALHEKTKFKEIFCSAKNTVTLFSLFLHRVSEVSSHFEEQSIFLNITNQEKNSQAYMKHILI